MTKEYLNWIKKGDEDSASLEALLKHREGSPSTGCFLAQQAIEKFLKALHVSVGLEPEKMHDLAGLAGSLIKTYPEIESFYKKLTVFNRYYIESRYPGDYPELTWKDCQQALNVVNEIKGYIESAVR